MKGVWLNQNDSAAAVGKTVPTFGKFKPTLKQRKTKSNRTEFFIPSAMMTSKMQKYYYDEMIEYDDEAQEVENVLGDVTEGIEALPSNSEELNAARLENLKARTAFINEKLDARKTELFSEWSEKFFDIFSNAFAKFKNDLISLHLTEEQLDTLTEKLELALKSMNDGITQINADWMKEEEKEENN